MLSSLGKNGVLSAAGAMPMRFECRSFVWRMVKICFPAGAAESEEVAAAGGLA